MKFKTIWFRKAHRYLGLSIGIQLLFWTISGFFFAWNDIDAVHGDPFVAHRHPTFLMDTVKVLPVADVVASLRRSIPGTERVKSVSLREILRRPMYEIEYMAGGKNRFALVHAQTGVLHPPLTAAEAREVAEDDFAPEAPVVGVERIESVSAASEYREKPLPAYRITFDHESGTHIYVSAERGSVTARRNDRWRAWDFLWAFHILDFQTRDNFHNWLLRGMSVLAVITVLSGFLLWAFTSPKLRKLFARKL